MVSIKKCVLFIKNADFSIKMWIKYQKGQFQYKNFIINFDSKFELSKLSIFHNLKIEIGFWVDLMICMFGKLVKIMYSLMFCDKNKSQIIQMISN